MPDTADTLFREMVEPLDNWPYMALDGNGPTRASSAAR
jgi:hypothetical protein